MVTTVISNQLSVIRKDLKPILCMWLWIFQPFSLNAKDCGTHGIIYPIEEKDPIQLIQQKLKNMEARGELEKHHLELQKKTRASVERPPPVEGITQAQKTRVFYYDPTYMLQDDLKDHQGHIFYKKGTKINPLETVSLSHELLFFNGDDLEQKAWAIQKLQEKPLRRLILIKGPPLSLSEELKVPMYFDQHGFLTKKLGIQHTPALVTQEGFRLRIEEKRLQAQANQKEETL
jgi:conjugal transfer pilus assembly protein TraW